MGKCDGILTDAAMRRILCTLQTRLTDLLSSSFPAANVFVFMPGSRLSVEFRLRGPMPQTVISFRATSTFILNVDVNADHLETKV